MRFSVLFVLLFLGGCATGARSVEDILTQPRIRTVSATSAGESNQGSSPEVIRYVEDPVIIREDLASPVPVVWDQLLQRYSEESLIPDQLDESTRTLAVSRFELRGEFRGTPVGTFLDCGLSSTGRPLAESARIQATIISRVSPIGAAASQISTRFEAVAFPSGASGGRVQDCYTTGELERMLVGRVRSALGEEEASRVGTASPSSAPSGSIPAANHSSSAAVQFPVEPGERIRLHTSPTERYTGTFLVFRNDTVLVRRSRVTAVPFSSVNTLEVQRTKTGPIIAGAGIGAAAGVAIAVSTGLGITGRHEVQGKILNPGLGVVAGGLFGAFLASKLFGNRWEEVPLEFETSTGQGSPRAGIGVRIPQGGSRQPRR